MVCNSLLALQYVRECCELERYDASSHEYSEARDEYGIGHETLRYLPVLEAEKMNTSIANAPPNHLLLICKACFCVPVFTTPSLC